VGQSKKFAALSPIDATAELSFESDVLSLCPNEKDDPNHDSSHDVDYGAAATLHSQKSSESESSDDLSNRKARLKKHARVERRLLRTAKKPAIHKASSALIPLSRDIKKPVWRFNRKK
jgi:hypothetical protein